MMLNETPKIEFEKTNQNIIKLNEFLKNNENTLLVNYSNKDILSLYLKNILNNMNFIEGIDFSIINENNYSIFQEFINDEFKLETEYKSLLFLFKDIIDKELIFKRNFIFIIDSDEKNTDLLLLFKRLPENINIKIIYLNKNLIEADLKISGTFDLSEEQDIRKYIETHCDIDKNKLLRIISNHIYNEFEANNDKVEVLNKYKTFFNDIETILLDSIIQKSKEKTAIKKDKVLTSNNEISNNKDEINENKEIMEDVENRHKKMIKKEQSMTKKNNIQKDKQTLLNYLYIFGGVVFLGGVFYFMIG